ncbi:MAG: class I SAM-dependent methyltransferase [Oscillospiraceae bacterium]|jgi:tRNA (adenine22-N1)-methyltransferase|nr:class I SAM-dependent methyltransferase [Oscillospiraceae bacterium]
MSLGKRLQLIASMIRRGSRLADIGTDHALLPIWVIKNNICPFVIATDISAGSATRANLAVKNAGLESRIFVRLGDGLSPLHPDEIDDIVIAGLGGETISQIIDAARWARDDRYNFVLGPMSKTEELHKYLLTKGFSITDEQTCTHRSRIYPILTARFDPKAAAAQAKHPAAFIRGVLDTERDYTYLKNQHDRLVAAATALRKAGRGDDAEKLEQTAKELFL